MQSFYPERFERDMGCTQADWLRCLPDAIGVYPWQLGANTAMVRIGAGALELRWRCGEPRVIACVHLPRLLVNFCFSGLTELQRGAFMQRFDLHMQRGGG